MDFLEKRSIPKTIILSIVTCGIYAMYWLVKLTDETHAALGRENTAKGTTALIFTIITCGIYGFYWVYMMGEAITEAKTKRGMHADGNTAFIYVALYFFGLGLISQALLQDSLNDIIEHDGNGSQTGADVQPPLDLNATDLNFNDNSFTNKAPSPTVDLRKNNDDR